MSHRQKNKHRSRHHAQPTKFGVLPPVAAAPPASLAPAEEQLASAAASTSDSGVSVSDKE